MGPGVTKDAAQGWHPLYRASNERETPFLADVASWRDPQALHRVLRDVPGGREVLLP